MTEKSESYEVEKELPPLDPLGRGERAALVLGELGLTGKENEVMLVSCRVEQFTVEAKIRPADYEQARGYVSLVPENLWVHVPIYNPGQKVTDSGDVGILGAVYRYVARELDMAVFQTASERVDRRTVLADAGTKKKGGVNAGTTIRPGEPKSTVL